MGAVERNKGVETYYSPAPPWYADEDMVFFMRHEMPVAVAPVYRWGFVWCYTGCVGRGGGHFRPRDGRVGGRESSGAWKALVEKWSFSDSLGFGSDVYLVDVGGA